MTIQFSARADSLDFRDRMYEPSLTEVPTRLDLAAYRSLKIPVLNQKKSWACTGFALATVVHYMLRRRKVEPDTTLVSHAMLFEMARRYDDYAGERYLGANARGGMKGWYNHGVCSEERWPHTDDRKGRRLTTARAEDAAKRPLGAYLRVNHQDLTAMHCALAEVGILFAVANVHEGWVPGIHRWGKKSVMEWPKRILPSGKIGHNKNMLGAHAIAIVGYDEKGFWVQNSWGEGWGENGIGFLPYGDWIENGLDAWVARLGVPVLFTAARADASLTSGNPTSRANAMRVLRPHVVRVDREGYLRTDDTLGTSEEDLVTRFRDDSPSELCEFNKATAGWKKKRILLVAGSGLISADAAVHHAVADHRSALLDAHVFPLAFIWRTGFWNTVGAILRDALGRLRPDTEIGADSDFMMDRLDAALEPLARYYSGKLHWDHVKQTALNATTLAEGAARLTVMHLARLMDEDPSIEIHLIGHGAGAILLAPVVQLLTTRGRVTVGPLKGRPGLGKRIESCVLWAPACTSDLFHQTYYRAIHSGRLRRFMLMTLDDKTEQADNCAGIYGKSFLYLVSNALEERSRRPQEDGTPISPEDDGTPIVGMETFIRRYPELLALFRRKEGRCKWVIAPNTAGMRKGAQSTARHHGDFDDDDATLRSTFSFILDGGALREVKTRRSASSKRERRRQL